MNKKLTWEQIKKEYPAQWVMLINYKLDYKNVEPSEGEVVANAKKRKEFGELIKKVNYNDAAIMFTGEIFDGHSILCNMKNR